MTNPFLITWCVLAIGTLLVHSFFKRGPVHTVNFFLFSFIYTFTKGGEHTFDFINISRDGMTVLLGAFFGAMVWVIGFYCSWFIAQKISERSGIFKENLFAVILFSGLSMAAFGYLLEGAGFALGWWGLKLSGDVSPLAVSLFLIKKWFFFSVYFFAAYFFIMCSVWKEKDWKIIFFLLPFIHAWIPQFFGRGISQLIEEWGVILFLGLMVFVNPLRFLSPVTSSSIKKGHWLPLIVLVSLIVLCGSLLWGQVNPSLMLRLVLPLAFLILFAIQKVASSL